MLITSSKYMGGMYVVSKYVLDFIPPLTLVWLRFIIAFVVLYGILKLAEKSKRKSNHSQKDWLLFAWIDLSAISFRSHANLSENYPTLIQAR